MFGSVFSSSNSSGGGVVSTAGDAWARVTVYDAGSAEFEKNPIVDTGETDFGGDDEPNSETARFGGDATWSLNARMISIGDCAPAFFSMLFNSSLVASVPEMWNTFVLAEKKFAILIFPCEFATF